MQEFTPEAVLSVFDAQQGLSERDLLLAMKGRLPDAKKYGKPENELKFAITEIPEDIQEGIRSGKYHYEVISQGYMRLPHKNEGKEGRKMRARELWNPEQGVRRNLASKTRPDEVDRIVNLEDEREVEDFDTGVAIWKEASKKMLRKIRFHIPQQDAMGVERIVELDIYLGSLRGLVTAEVEFKQREEAVQFQEKHLAQEGVQKPIVWLGKDLTSGGEFGSGKLAEANSLPAGTVVCDISSLGLEKVLERRARETKNVLDTTYPEKLS